LIIRVKKVGNLLVMLVFRRQNYDSYVPGWFKM
jgi:hypothetical protein